VGCPFNMLRDNFFSGEANKLILVEAGVNTVVTEGRRGKSNTSEEFKIQK
jgi:hypothetical protein